MIYHIERFTTFKVGPYVLKPLFPQPMVHVAQVPQLKKWKLIKFFSLQWQVMPRIGRYITKSLNFPNKQDPTLYWLLLRLILFKDGLNWKYWSKHWMFAAIDSNSVFWFVSFHSPQHDILYIQHQGWILWKCNVTCQKRVAPKKDSKIFSHLGHKCNKAGRTFS